MSDEIYTRLQKVYSNAERPQTDQVADEQRSKLVSSLLISMELVFSLFRFDRKVTDPSKEILYFAVKFDDLISIYHFWQI